MGIETEEDVQVLSSYFLKHRAAAQEADADSDTVHLAYLLTSSTDSVKQCN